MLGADSLDLPGQANALNSDVRPERGHPAPPSDQVAGLPSERVNQPGQGGHEDNGDQQHAPSGAEDRIALAAGEGDPRRGPRGQPPAPQAAQPAEEAPARTTPTGPPQPGPPTAPAPPLPP